MEKEWVAIQTFVDEVGGVFYEEGGVYDHKPRLTADGARELTLGEPTVVCPRCGQRFAATEDGTAESHRDLHFDGDEDSPSICRNFPARELRLAKGDGTPLDAAPPSTSIQRSTAAVSVYVVIRKDKAVARCEERIFTRVPAVGEYFADKNDESKFRVIRVVHWADPSADYDADVWAVEASNAEWFGE